MNGILNFLMMILVLNGNSKEFYAILSNVLLKRILIYNIVYANSTKTSSSLTVSPGWMLILFIVPVIAATMEFCIFIASAK